MIYLLLALILIVVLVILGFEIKGRNINVDVVVNKDAINRIDMPAGVQLSQDIHPILGDISFTAAVVEERRQMAFGRFCLNYNDGLDMFCSKPAGHQNYNEADRNPEVRKHGYAGISWSG